jgi:hypothetical protein
LTPCNFVATAGEASFTLIEFNFTHRALLLDLSMQLPTDHLGIGRELVRFPGLLVAYQIP